jgi:molecular chaperone DnaK
MSGDNCMEIVAQEYTFLNSTTPLEAAIEQLHRISFQILRRTPNFLVGWFQHLFGKRQMFNDQLQAKNLIEDGKQHIAADDYEKLAEVNARLHSLLPQTGRWGA